MAKIYIRKNLTGEVRLYDDDLRGELDYDGTPSVYDWEDGNYSCDCNRRLFFARANNEPDDWDGGCSDGEYSVKIEVNGEVIYAEF